MLKRIYVELPDDLETRVEIDRLAKLISREGYSIENEVIGEIESEKST